MHRPWYREDSVINPDVMVANPTAITTRVAPSFLRGWVSLNSLRGGHEATHPDALNELQMIVKHLMERNYKDEMDSNLAFADQVVELASLFRERLRGTGINWIRVGYCQEISTVITARPVASRLIMAPLDSVNCLILDFNPGPGAVNAFLSLINRRRPKRITICFGVPSRPLLTGNEEALARLDKIREGFSGDVMIQSLRRCGQRSGLLQYDATMVKELLHLMMRSGRITMFFRRGCLGFLMNCRS